MSAIAEKLHTRSTKAHVTPVRDAKEVVAVILADGTVRELRDNDTGDTERRISNGSLSGSDWVLWWTRRSFEVS